MQEHHQHDPYVQLHGVLKNRYGITDEKLLEVAEREFSKLRMQELQQTPIKGKLDLKHLQAIHKKLFGDLYGWAGQLRTVDMTKGDTFFAHVRVLESCTKDLFNQLAKDHHLKNLDAKAFAQKAGYYLGELNVLHPFREGNGRTQRVFLGQLAQKAGFVIEWKNITQEQMRQASIQAYESNSDLMAKLIFDNLKDLKTYQLQLTAKSLKNNSTYLQKEFSQDKNYQVRVDKRVQDMINSDIAQKEKIKSIVQLFNTLEQQAKAKQHYKTKILGKMNNE